MKFPASLRRRLTLLIIGVMVVVLIPLGVLTYQLEAREMTQLLDGRLAQAGRTLGMLIEQSTATRDTQPTGANQHAATPLPVREAMIVTVHQRNYEPEVGFQAYNAQGRPLMASDNLQDLPPPTLAERGFHDIDHQGHRWRIFTLQNRYGLVIRIGERVDNRQTITHALVLEHSLPLLIGLPLLALLVSWAVRRGLAPLSALTVMLNARTPGSRQPVQVMQLTPELLPLVRTLNQQFERLEDAIERERRFNADVAHELRTPLAAMMIHLESAALTDSPTEIAAALSSAQRSLLRLARRIEQILALARLEAGAAANQRTPQDLVAIATEAIEELAPLIAGKDVALSLSHEPTQINVSGHEAALSALFHNLIENALRYVERGGQVDVALHHTNGMAMIDVIDNGPGIPAERRQFVFDRFHRENRQPSAGYGLGLNIVKRAIELHGGTVELLDSPHGHGLHVRIRLPL